MRGRLNLECRYMGKRHNIQQEIFNVQFSDQPQAAIHEVNPLRPDGKWGMASSKWGNTIPALNI